MIYLLIGILIIILSYVEAITKDKRFSIYSLSIIFFSILLLAALRDKVGTDWYSYFKFYQNTTDAVEIGYATINNVFSSLSIPYNIFLFVINGFSLTLMYLFLRKHSILFVIGALIFFSDLFLYFNLSGIRQAVAMSITCFSLRYALNKQFWKFLLVVLFATTFHLSAIIFVCTYFLPKKQISLRHLVFLFLGFLSTYLFLNSISDLITLYTIKNVDFYVNAQEKADNLRGLFYVGIAKRSIIVLVIMTFGRKILKQADVRYFLHIYLFGFAIYLSSYMVSPDIGVRLSSYFIIFEILLAGNILYFTKKMHIRILVVTIFACVSIYKLSGYMKDETYVYNSIINLF